MKIDLKGIKLALVGIGALVMATLMATGCGGGAGPDPRPGSPGIMDSSSEITIVIDEGASTEGSRAFGANPLTISLGEEEGTRVTWINRDREDHTVTARDGSFNSGPIRPGESFTHLFTQPGTFDYSCSIHPSMTGRIEVRGSSPTVTRTPPPPPAPEPTGEDRRG